MYQRWLSQSPLPSVRRNSMGLRNTRGTLPAVAAAGGGEIAAGIAAGMAVVEQRVAISLLRCELAALETSLHVRLPALATHREGGEMPRDRRRGEQLRLRGEVGRLELLEELFRLQLAPESEVRDQHEEMEEGHCMPIELELVTVRQGAEQDGESGRVGAGVLSSCGTAQAWATAPGGKETYSELADSPRSVHGDGGGNAAAGNWGGDATAGSSEAQLAGQGCVGGRGGDEPLAGLVQQLQLLLRLPANPVGGASRRGCGGHAELTPRSRHVRRAAAARAAARSVAR